LFLYTLTNNEHKGAIMKKQFMAILAALFITACVGASIFAIGGAAVLNKNTAPLANSASQISAVSDPSQSQQDQVAQLQDLVSQYQNREQQYQQREQQLQDQLTQANTQIQQDAQLLQQVQSLLGALQQRGLIQITSDGRIFITQ
jgi:peptidoglycan hydrolase CwlO-like protein